MESIEVVKDKLDKQYAQLSDTYNSWLDKKPKSKAALLRKMTKEIVVTFKQFKAATT